MGEPTPEEPPGVFQYQGGRGPDRQTTEQGFYAEGFPHSPANDQRWLDWVGAEADAAGQIVSVAKAVDNWNVERDLLPPE